MTFNIFGRDHLRFRVNIGVISSPGSFAVHFGDHVRSLEHLRTCTKMFIFLCTHEIQGAGGIRGRDMPQSLASKGEVGLARKMWCEWRGQ